MHEPILTPSILAGNHANLGESLGVVESSGLAWVHLDIMDGHFVPNLTFGPQAVADLRKGSALFFDTHLMLDNPDKFVEAFAKAGADLITIHVEPDYPVMETLDRIRDLGCQVGVSLNPGTPAEAILPFIDKVDLVLVMTVQPGYGGQSFMSDMLPKIREIDGWRKERGLAFRLEVDGGVDLVTVKDCWEAGADTFVAGTAFYRAEDKGAFVSAIKSLSV